MLLKKVIILQILVLSFFCVYSQESDNSLLFEQANYNFPYCLEKHDQLWKLPKSLMEISGLSYIDKNELACVQDEKGNIYIFNLVTGKVDEKIDFGNDGDYEGVEIVKNDVWILKSNGTLYKIKDYLKKKNPDVKKHTTALTGKNDAEGLTHDPLSNNLLIACKGHPFVDDKEGREFKAVYSFDLETKQMVLKPFLLIEMDTIKYYKNYNNLAMLGVELIARFDSSKGDVSFQPSGIAVNPISGNIYILGSVGNLIIVFSRDGVMLAIIKLKSKFFPQPEGICFSPEGTLYIANEGDKNNGTLLKFEYLD